MAQPSFVPIAEADQVRPSLSLEPPRIWVQERPAEIRFPASPGGRHLGTPGPDQGYALRLARRLCDRLHLAAGESEEDVLVGASLIASRRAALLGRAPTVFDLETAYGLWGFFDEDPPEELVAARRQAFSGVSHDYHAGRALVDLISDEAIRLSAGEAAERVVTGRWHPLVSAVVAGDSGSAGTEAQAP